MANHKRNKSKRTVKCTICTKVRWMGNNRGRVKDKEADIRKRSDKEIDKYEKTKR